MVEGKRNQGRHTKHALTHGGLHYSINTDLHDSRHHCLVQQRRARTRDVDCRQRATEKARGQPQQSKLTTGEETRFFIEG